MCYKKYFVGKIVITRMSKNLYFFYVYVLFIPINYILSQQNGNWKPYSDLQNPKNS